MKMPSELDTARTSPVKLAGSLQALKGIAVPLSLGS